MMKRKRARETAPATPAAKAKARAALAKAAKAAKKASKPNARRNTQATEHAPNPPAPSPAPTLAGQDGRVAALRLRRAGKNYRAIAAELGVSTSTAFRRVRTAIAQLPREAAADVKELELARLDAMLEALWPKVLDGLAYAIRAALRIMQRRAALLGLDAPRAMAVSLPPPPPGQIVLVLEEAGCSPPPPPSPAPTSGSSSTPPSPGPTAP